MEVSTPSRLLRLNIQAGAVATSEQRAAIEAWCEILYHANEPEEPDVVAACAEIDGVPAEVTRDWLWRRMPRMPKLVGRRIFE
jgi:hypothetical protein